MYVCVYVCMYVCMYEYINNIRVSALKRIINCSFCLHTAFLTVNNAMRPFITYNIGRCIWIS